MRRSWHLAAGLALLLVTAAPAPTSQAPTEPEAAGDARAWALWVHVPGQPVVTVATANATLGGTTVAAAAPASVAGSAPRRVRADGETHEDTDELGSWLDPTASMSLRGASMEARTGPAAAVARVSVATGAGSGFAVADELFTWEQQEQFLGAWGDANAAVFEAANQALAPLGPLMAPRNLVVPRLEPMAPFGFVDVAGVEQLAARAEVVRSPGFVASTAASDVGRVKLFGGFVQLDDVRVSVHVEHVGSDRVARPAVSIGRTRIAGIEVEATGDGLVVAANDMASRTVLQPVLDQLLEQLAAAGIWLDLATSRDTDGRLQTSAFEAAIATPDGMALASVGHVEAGVADPASAPPTPPAPPGAPPDEPSPPPPAPDVPPPAGALAAPPPSTATPPITSGTPAPTGVAPPAAATSQPPAATALRLAAPPPAAARALGLAYLLTATGVLTGGVVLLTLVGRRPTPRPRGRERP